MEFGLSAYRSFEQRERTKLEATVRSVIQKSGSGGGYFYSPCTGNSWLQILKDRGILQ